MQGTQTKRNLAAWLVVLFLVVLGAQLWVVQLFGSALPLWDQWIEADRFFRPWQEGHLTWTDLIAAHNEHRILLTRLLDMGVIWLNGRWEPLLQMTVNAVILAAFVCALAFCLWDFLGRRHGWLVCFLVAPFYMLPYAAENTVWAFNSQQYFLPVCALATLFGLGFGKACSRRWWLGLAAAFLGLFTMASGFLAAAAVGGIIILRSLKNWRVEKEDALTFIMCLVVIALGLALNVTPADVQLRAHTPAEFLGALARNLAWPFITSSRLMCSVTLLPLVVLAGVYFRKTFTGSRAAEFLLGLGLWSALQSAALAFGRANYGDGIPASRYMDVLNLLVIAAIFAVVLLLQAWSSGKTEGRFALLLPLVLAGVFFFNLGKISHLVVEQLLIPTRTMDLLAEERVQTFLTTGNEKEFLESPTVQPEPKVTLKDLQSKELQSIMPGLCQPPGQRPPPNRLMMPGEFLLQNAPLILSAGLGLFALLCGVGLTRGTLGIPRENLAAIITLLVTLLTLGFVWSRGPITRNSIEFDLQTKLAAHFEGENHPARAAFHAAKAAALKNSTP